MILSGLTMGSLFDGIGGFPLAAARYGIQTIWASEIEPLLTSINATLDEMQAKLAQVQDSADSEIKSAVRDYLPRHQELKALINDPQHSAEVSHFLCMLDSF